MSGVAYALISFAVLYVIGWYIQNERSGADSPGDKGLIAMTATRADRSAEKQKRTGENRP